MADVEKSLANVMAAIEQGIITATTKKRLSELETLKTDLEVKIAKEEIQTQILTKEQVEFWLKNMEKLDLTNADNKQRLINTFINSIYVHDDKFVVNFNCREESEVIPRDLEGDVSSLTILGEPTKCYQKDIMPANGGTKPFVGINFAKNRIHDPQIFSTRKWT